MQQIDLLIKNATIATMTENGKAFGLVEEGCIAVSGETILFVGPQSELPLTLPVQGDVIDAGGKLVTPGLIDCHTHIVFGGNRAGEFEMRLNGATYEEIALTGGGIVSTVSATRQNSEAELYQSAQKRIKNFIAEGVTTMEIKSGYGLNFEDEVKMLKVARQLGENLHLNVTTTYLGAHAEPPEYKGNSDVYIHLIVNEYLPKIAELGLADAVDAFCEKIGFSPEQTREVFDQALALGLPVKLHADQLSDLGGGALVAYKKGLSADHVEYSSAKSLFAMAQNDTVAVLLPGAFYALKETQKPDIETMRKFKVDMAIASDSNPGSSPVLSLLLMLNMACTLFELTPEEALKGVTINAAKALNMQDTVGSLEIGKQADIILWDLDQPAELSYWIGGRAVLKRIYKGKIS